MSPSYDAVVQKEIVEYIDTLVAHLGDLELKFRIWLALTEELRQRPETLNLAPGFFVPVRSALVTDVILSLSRLFEDRSDRNIPHLLRRIEQDLSRLESKKEILRSPTPDVPPLEVGIEIDLETIQQHRLRICEAEKLVTVLLTHRDKFYAHHDKEYFGEPSKLQDEAPLGSKDIESLILTAEEILTTYLAAFKGVDLRISPTSPTQTTKVLRILQKVVAGGMT